MLLMLMVMVMTRLEQQQAPESETALTEVVVPAKVWRRMRRRPWT